MTLARLQQQNYSIRAMACLLHRSPSTISRELSRIADASGYASSQAQKPLPAPKAKRQTAAQTSC
jgi:IS30 family transposase